MSGAVGDALVGRERVVVATRLALALELHAALVALVALGIAASTHGLAAQRVSSVGHVLRHQVGEVLTVARVLVEHDALEERVGRVVVDQSARALGAAARSDAVARPGAAVAVLVAGQAPIGARLGVVRDRTRAYALVGGGRVVEWQLVVSARDAVGVGRSATPAGALVVTVLALARLLVAQEDVLAVDGRVELLAASLHARLVQLVRLAELTERGARRPAAATRRVAHIAVAF